MRRDRDSQIMPKRVERYVAASPRPDKTRQKGNIVKAFRILQAAMMVQILLGLWRFTIPYIGWSVDGRVWQVHPFLGIGIAVAALVLFRPENSAASSPSWTAARFIALVPLGLGLAMRYGVVHGLAAMLVHMVVGLTALGLIDSSIKKESSRRSSAAPAAQQPSDAAPASG